MKALKKKKMVNHVAFLLDASGSMAGLTNATREVLSKLLDGLATEEKKSGIETRLHLYTFGYRLQPELTNVNPRAAGSFVYSSRGEGTALIDSTMELIDRLGEYSSTKDDVSFLVYVLTDGQNTENGNHASRLRSLLRGLNDDWTLAIMVPNDHCKGQAISYGFPADNIQIWETTAKGMQELGRNLAATNSSYYSMRSAGVKSTKSLFKFEDNLAKSVVKKAMEEVNPGEYETLLVRKGDDGRAIKDFVESWTKAPYRVGSAYYQVTKPEKIQAGKVLAVVDKMTGKMYSGMNARNLLGLPHYEVKAEPASFKNYDLFVQSTSTNRKLVADTHLIVFK